MLPSPIGRPQPDLSLIPRDFRDPHLMHLYLIRHAESENNIKPEHQRVEDPSITSRGVEQAECLAGWLRSLSPRTLVSSPFRRAIQTTVPASQNFPGSLEVWSDIFERGGCYRGWTDDSTDGGEGMKEQEILALLPAAQTDLPSADIGWWNCRPREQDHETRERARGVRRKLENRLACPDETLVAVTHAEFLRMLLAELLRESSLDVKHFGPICNTGITYLRGSESGWKLHWFNAVTHLHPSLITGAKG